MSDAIREAARALLTALDASDEASIGIFAVASLHGAKYDGPTHGVQKEVLRAAILAPEGKAPHPAATVEAKRGDDVIASSRIEGRPMFTGDTLTRARESIERLRPEREAADDEDAGFASVARGESAESPAASKAPAKDGEVERARLTTRDRARLVVRLEDIIRSQTSRNETVRELVRLYESFAAERAAKEAK